MNLTNLTMGAVALGLLAISLPTMTAPALALPSAVPALAAGAASDIAKARYQDYPGARASKATKGRSSAPSQKYSKSGAASGKARMAGQSGSQGRSAIQGRSSSSQGRSDNQGRSQQWRSSVGGHGIAPYSDIPHRAMKHRAH
ncbi:hypothetical protein FM996_03330 [Methylosinus sporium]|uniref:DUF3300 domain-containing protein n=1 Tax=Methylosinus sporium TaxID=428 RepID=A0A549T5Q7_METSR|nr:MULTISPECIES: hypothetical protein [Methylosinus]MBU3890693.1 hypothetical protein [Methylosinus sp. KRF6]TRL37221.1 hypothetical protein FM996_03330 [Methylosinus sporium]